MKRDKDNIMSIVRVDPNLNKAGLAALAQNLSPHLNADDQQVSSISGGYEDATERLGWADPVAYAKTRNHLDGSVTQLSPFIRHGVLSLSHVRDVILEAVGNASDAEKMVQQLAWRDYWQRLYKAYGSQIWDDLEEYKTGFSAADYSEIIPEDILGAETGVAAIDHFIKELIDTGWIHNHARLYLASYVCHFRRIQWQAGARFFLSHLLDGDPASNNLSWQWVASTFSHKPYYFNLENLQRFCGSDIDTSFRSNRELAGSYEDLHLRLFPNLPPPVPQGRKGRKS